MHGELAPRPGSGRVVRLGRHVGLGDVGGDGRVRLDALARFLQDVADHDLVTAGVETDGAWLLRRVLHRVRSWPRFRADLVLTTWCSGTGPRWAERRTDVHVGERLCVEAVGLWVHVDPRRGPVPLPAGFDETWGGRDRRVSARLSHPAPPADARARPWPVRAVDVDVMGHVNDAAYWAAVEQELAHRDRRCVAWAEHEFRRAVERDDEVTLRVSDQEGGFGLWWCVAGEVRASALVGCAGR